MLLSVGEGLTDPEHVCPDWAAMGYQVDEFGVPNSREDGGGMAWARHQGEFHSIETECACAIGLPCDEEHWD